MKCERCQGEIDTAREKYVGNGTLTRYRHATCPAAASPESELTRRAREVLAGKWWPSMSAALRACIDHDAMMESKIARCPTAIREWWYPFGHQCIAVARLLDLGLVKGSRYQCTATDLGRECARLLSEVAP